MICNIVEIGGKKDGVFRRNIFTTTKEIKKYIQDFNEEDVYATVYKYDDKNQDTANVIAPLYIDLDVNDIEENFDKLKRDLALVLRQIKTLLKITDKELEIFFSGSKGFHIMVDSKVLGLTPSTDLNDLYKLIAIKLKTYTILKCVDTRIYDKKRLFRIPNTINSKTGLYKVPITYEKLKDMTYDDMKEYASSKKPNMPKIYKINHKAHEAFFETIEKIKEEEKRTINHKAAREIMERRELLPCVKYILQNGALKGGRNNLTMALASSLFQVGKTYEECLDIVVAWNDKKNEPPLPQREIQTTVNSAFRNVQDGRKYGCSAFRDLDVCVKGCPVKR